MKIKIDFYFKVRGRIYSNLVTQHLAQNQIYEREREKRLDMIYKNNYYF